MGRRLPTATMAMAHTTILMTADTRMGVTMGMNAARARAMAMEMAMAMVMATAIEPGSVEAVFLFDGAA